MISRLWLVGVICLQLGGKGSHGRPLHHPWRRQSEESACFYEFPPTGSCGDAFPGYPQCCQPFCDCATPQPQCAKPRCPGGPGATTIIVGAGMAGLGAARTLTDFGCKVTVLEARDYIGGRLASKLVTDAAGRTFPLELGANWIHGESDNPLYCLNKQQNLVWTQQFQGEGFNNTPTSIANLTRWYFIARSGNVYDTLPDGCGNLTTPLRELFGGYSGMLYQENFEPWYEAVLTGDVFKVPDIAVNRLLDWYVKSQGITGDDLDILLLGAYSAQSYDANDLSRLGNWATVGAHFGYDYMVGWPGYSAIPQYLAQGINIQLQQVVTRIDLGAGGVKVTVQNAATNKVKKYAGRQVLVTVPIGVLQNRQIEFRPGSMMPPRLWQAIDTMGVMGVMDKHFFVYHNPWWPSDYDIFLSLNETDSTNQLSSSLWINLHNYNGTNQGPPVLLSLEVGNYAKQLENLDDESAMDALLGRLRQTLPSYTVPRPDYYLRTKWWQDPFSRGAYSAPPVGVTPQMFAEMNKPVPNTGKPRLWFAGEANSQYRFGYADGAYANGVLQAQAMLCTGKQKQQAGH